MKYIITLISVVTISTIQATAVVPSDIFLSIEESNFCQYTDSDSVKTDVNAPVVSFSNRLYQLGIQIGTYDKKTSIAKAQMTTRIQVYDMSGKAIAEAVSAGVNASFAITIFGSNEKLSMNLAFDHEAEELALKLRQMGKL